MIHSIPFSIFIICHDEAERLPKVLDSIKGMTDDLVIIDSGSTDGTIEIAKQYTDRVLHRDWEGYGQQKVFGEAECKYDWILNLDADEVLLPEVRQNIERLFAGPKDQNLKPAYSLRFCHVSSFSKSLKANPFAPVNVTPRLYNRTQAGFKDSAVHDKVVTYDGSKPGLIEGDVAHISFKSFAHMWDKTKFYAELQAKDWHAKGRSPGVLRALFDPPIFFLKQYILRRFCFIGVEGLLISIILAGGRALRIGMTMELCRKSKDNTSE